MYTSIIHRSGYYFRWTDISCTHIAAAIIPPLILYLCINMHIIIITTSSLNSSSSRLCPPSLHLRSVVFSPISLIILSPCVVIAASLLSTRPFPSRLATFLLPISCAFILRNIRVMLSHNR
jgi:hypothetical protein